jgi:hypothetical protein
VSAGQRAKGSSLLELVVVVLVIGAAAGFDYDHEDDDEDDWRPGGFQQCQRAARGSGRGHSSRNLRDSVTRMSPVRSPRLVCET